MTYCPLKSDGKGKLCTHDGNLYKKCVTLDSPNCPVYADSIKPRSLLGASMCQYRKKSVQKRREKYAQRWE